MMNARCLALKILLSLNKTLYIQSALDMFLNKYSLNEKDKGLCTELVYGYLRHEIRIKYILNHFLKNTQNIPQEMFITLGLAVYSILFLTKIPDYASVNWAVEHTKNTFNLKLSTVTNAVLRNIIRRRDDLDTISFYVANTANKISTVNESANNIAATKNLFNAAASSIKVSANAKAKANANVNSIAKASTKNNENADVANNEFNALAIFYSVPSWIANLWKDFFGETKACRLMEKFSHKPSVGLRLNYKHNDFDKIKNALLEANGFALNNSAFMFNSGQMPRELMGFSIRDCIKDGLCSYQSAGSILAVDAMINYCCHSQEDTDLREYNDIARKQTQLVGNVAIGAFKCALERSEQHSLDVKVKQLQIDIHNSGITNRIKEPIWDMCAGQGGKTSALLERGYAVTLATDVNLNRLKLLEKNIVRLKLPMPSIVLVDKNHSCIQKWEGTILIDAPCSGLGILQRRPDIKRIKTFEDMQSYVLVQKELLSRAWEKLEIGGIILYVTCTINPLENQIQIRNFLNTHKNATLISEWQSDIYAFSCEGMYVASIQKCI